MRIKAVRVYRDFADMLAAEDWKQIVPQVNTREDALQLLREIYPPAKEQLGIYVLEIR